MVVVNSVMKKRGYFMINLFTINLKQIMPSRKNCIIVVLILVILIPIALFLGSGKQKTTALTLGIVDNDNNIYSKMLVSYFEDNESFSKNVKILKGTNDEMEAIFHKNQIDAYIEIPEGFVENMMNLNNVPIKVRISNHNATKSIVLLNVLSSYEKYISAVEVGTVTLYDMMTLNNLPDEEIEDKNVQLSYDLIFTALGRDTFFDWREVVSTKDTPIMVYILFAVKTILLLYMGVYSGMNLIKEFEKGTYLRYKMTGSKVVQFFLAKIWTHTLAFALLCTMIDLLLYIVAKERITIGTVMINLVTVLFSTSLSSLFACIIRKKQDYVFICNMMIFIFCLIGGALIPIMYLPNNMIGVAKVTPVYWFIQVFLLIRKGIISAQVKVVITTLLACSALFILLPPIILDRRNAYE
jgi:ABC-2 type transport system permease protein